VEENNQSHTLHINHGIMPWLTPDYLPPSKTQCIIYFGWYQTAAW